MKSQVQWEAACRLEREQLQSFLSRQLARRPLEAFVNDSFAQLLSLDTPPLPKLRDQLRAFHDRLGYCAKGSLKSGGLCVGTLYRTREFIEQHQEQRIGSKKIVGIIGDARTVHVEHTVPVRELALGIARLDAAARRNRHFLLAWLLRHSVATAFAKGQERFHKGFTSSSLVFDRTADAEFNRPFARYFHLRAGAPEVWNIWSGQIVEPGRFTFDSHIEMMLDLLRECGASASALDRIAHHADEMGGRPNDNDVRLSCSAGWMSD
ncbi:MAG: hypothetical protein AB7E05_14450 [Sphingobium sp.]